MSALQDESRFAKKIRLLIILVERDEF